MVKMKNKKSQMITLIKLILALAAIIAIGIIINKIIKGSL